MSAPLTPLSPRSAPPPASPLPPLSPLRRAILVVGGLLSLVVITCATLSIVDHMGRDSYQEDNEFVTPGNQLRVRNSHDISITPSTDGKVHVHTSVQHGLAQPHILRQPTPDGVTLEADCHGWMAESSCSVTFEVQVPPAFSVEATSSTGVVSATGLAGDVALTTSVGEIRVSQMYGDLTLRSGAGEVFASELHSGAVTARSSVGNVSLSFAVPPQTVMAQTAAGDVFVTVPAHFYKITATSSAGEAFINPSLTSSDPDSRHQITATSRIGNVVVSPAAPRTSPPTQPPPPSPPAPPSPPTPPDEPAPPDGE